MGLNSQIFQVNFPISTSIGVLWVWLELGPDSANSQFFIMFEAGYFLNGQYTVVGKVNGMEIVDKIKRGEGPNYSVLGEPDKMVSSWHLIK